MPTILDVEAVVNGLQRLKDSHMKGAGCSPSSWGGVVVVGGGGGGGVNYLVSSHLGCLGQSTIMFSSHVRKYSYFNQRCQVRA